MSDAAGAPKRVTPAEKKPTIAVDEEAFSAAFAAKGCTSGDDRARLLGIPRRAVYRYAKGEVSPTLSRARRIAAKLGCDVDELWPAA